LVFSDPYYFYLWRYLKHINDTELEAILIHEFEHIRYKDNLIISIHMIVQTLFWFHPLVWLTGLKLIHEREVACDEAVLQSSKNPKDYAEGILKVCEYYFKYPSICVSGVVGFKLNKRMEAIMKNQIGCKLSIVKKYFLSIAVISVLGIPFIIGIINAPPIQAKSSEIVFNKIITDNKNTPENLQVSDKIEKNIESPQLFNGYQYQRNISNISKNDTIPATESTGKKNIENEKLFMIMTDSGNKTRKAPENKTQSLKYVKTELAAVDEEPIILANNESGIKETQVSAEEPIQKTSIGSDLIEYTLPQITVVGNNSLGSLERDVIKAKELIFEVFNNLNSTDEFDITCEWHAPLGTNIKRWSCDVGYLKKARENSTRDWMERDIPMPTEAVFRAQCAYKTRALNREMNALASIYPEMALAIVNAHELEQLYNEEVIRRYKGSYLIGNPPKRDLKVNKFYIWEAAFKDHKSKVMSDEVWARWDKMYRKIFNLPSFRNLWTSINHKKYSNEFVAYVQTIIAEN
jgi:hypothetical protein